MSRKLDKKIAAVMGQRKWFAKHYTSDLNYALEFVE